MAERTRTDETAAGTETSRDATARDTEASRDATAREDIARPETGDDAQTERRFARGTVDERRAPDDVTDLPKESWRGVVRRAMREYSDDNVTDWAAALTYYGVLSIFPMLLALVSLLGLFGQSATQAILDNLSSIAPGPAKDILTQAVTNLQKSQGAAGVLFVVGLAVALWSASGYVGAFMRASNAIWDVEEGRPAWKTIPLRLAVTALLLVLMTASALAVVVTGPLAKRLGDVVGLGNTAVMVWDIAKWPVLVLVVSLMIALLYYASPNVRHPKFQWVSPGSLLAVLLWIAASALFAFYVANFGSYNKTYGALGGVIVFLTWLWITNNVILLGAEVNAEIERGRQIQGGLRPETKEPFLEPRDTRKMKDRTEA
jgi:membrane protein